MPSFSLQTKEATIMSGSAAWKCLFLLSVVVVPRSSHAQFVPAPMPTPPPPTLPTGSSYLRYIDKEPDWPLGKCEGDCDKDSDCQGSLVCFRADKAFVWGCYGRVENPEKHNYCMDMSLIPPTKMPTRAPTPFPTTPYPTRRPTPWPTRMPSPSPSASPSDRPSSSPSVAPTAKPSASPSFAPSSLPSSSPTIPDKVYMGLEPIIIDLVFPKGIRSSLGDGSTADVEIRSEEDGSGQDIAEALISRSSPPPLTGKLHNGNVRGNGVEEEEVSLSTTSTSATITRKESEITAAYLDSIASHLVNEQIPLLNYFYWEVYLNSEVIGKTTLYPPDVPPIGKGGEGGVMARLQAVMEGRAQISLRYQLTGEYSFVNITDTILPSPLELKTATAKALNANALYRELTMSNHPLLKNIEYLAVNWADDDNSEGSDQKYRVLGAVILVMLIGLMGAIGFIRWKRLPNNIEHNEIILDDTRQRGEADSRWSGVGSSNDADDELPLKRLPRSWRGSPGKQPSPEKTADCSASFTSEDIDSSSASNGNVLGDIKNRSKNFFQQVTGHIRNKTPSTDHDAINRPEDLDISVSSEVESHLFSDIEGGEVSHCDDMTMNFSFANIAKRKEVDLLAQSCNFDPDNSIPLPKSYQMDSRAIDPCPSVLKSDYVPSEAGDNDDDGDDADLSFVDNEAGGVTPKEAADRGPESMQHDFGMSSDVGDREADFSMLESVMPQREVVSRAKSADKDETTPIKSNGNAVRATFAKVWQRKKKDTPSKLSSVAAAVMKASPSRLSEQNDETNKANADNDLTPSEMGSCKHEDIQVLNLLSDDASYVSALSTGGVSTVLRPSPSMSLRKDSFAHETEGIKETIHEEASQDNESENDGDLTETPGLDAILNLGPSQGDATTCILDEASIGAAPSVYEDTAEENDDAEGQSIVAPKEAEVAVSGESEGDGGVGQDIFYEPKDNQENSEVARSTSTPFDEKNEDSALEDESTAPFDEQNEKSALEDETSAPLEGLESSTAPIDE